jgi:hypothetical protein
MTDARRSRRQPPSVVNSDSRGRPHPRRLAEHYWTLSARTVLYSPAPAAAWKSRHEIATADPSGVESLERYYEKQIGPPSSEPSTKLHLVESLPFPVESEGAKTV